MAIAARNAKQRETSSPDDATAARTVTLAFDADQAARLTGLTQRQLAYWDRTGFFKPEYGSATYGTPYERVYSFRDIVGLRTLSVLRGEHGISMPHLKKVAAELASYSKAPWADIQLKVWNRQVVFVEPGTGRARGVVDGQYVLLALIDVIEDVRKNVEALKRRRPEQIGRIERHRYVAHNAPVLAGTRVPVGTIQRFLEDGYSPAAIIEEYPSLTETDIRAAADEGKGTVAA